MPTPNSLKSRDYRGPNLSDARGHSPWRDSHIATLATPAKIHPGFSPLNKISLRKVNMSWSPATHFLASHINLGMVGVYMIVPNGNANLGDREMRFGRLDTTPWKRNDDEGVVTIITISSLLVPCATPLGSPCRCQKMRSELDIWRHCDKIFESGGLCFLGCGRGS